MSIFYFQLMCRCVLLKLDQIVYLYLGIYKIVCNMCLDITLLRYMLCTKRWNLHNIFDKKICTFLFKDAYNEALKDVSETTYCKSY